MKKIILSMILGIMTITASAQLKSFDIKGDLRGDFGIGAGVTLGVNDKIDFAPAFNWFFTEGNLTVWAIDADFHYNFDVAQDFKVYPIAGLALYHWSVSNEGVNTGKTKLGVNLGCGCQYDFSDNLAGFVDLKYQWVDGADDTYFSLGVKIGL
ncbi:MAG: outer membrane beta-barrel protein [Bacteroidaceae bacterium]|nr:outer membrane beta-barrel protein [Bacteroidaceae bacterium]